MDEIDTCISRRHFLVDDRLVILGTLDKGSVTFYLEEGGSRKLGGSGTSLRSKRGDQKIFFKLKREDHFYFLKETKYFVKHFRFQRKGLSDATRGRKLQWDFESQLM